MSAIPILRLPLLAVMALRGASSQRSAAEEYAARSKSDSTRTRCRFRSPSVRAADDARGVGGRWLDLECRAFGGALLGHPKQGERNRTSKCGAENLAQ